MQKKRVAQNSRRHYEALLKDYPEVGEYPTGRSVQTKRDLAAFRARLDRCNAASEVVA